jgi:hypothetical protein
MQIADDLRAGVRKRLVPVMIAGVAGLAGCIDAAFLTAFAYTELAIAYGQGGAAFVLGCGFVALAAVLLALSRRSRAAAEPVKPPEKPASAANDNAAQIAFTVAFVLARHLGESRRDDHPRHPPTKHP